METYSYLGESCILQINHPASTSKFDWLDCCDMIGNIVTLTRLEELSENHKNTEDL